MSPVHSKFVAFANGLSKDQHGPQRKFIETVLVAILLAKSLVLSRIAHEYIRRSTVYERGSRAYDRETRYLARHLMSLRLNIDALLARYFEMIRPILQREDGRGVNIAVDETDYLKPRARLHARVRPNREPFLVDKLGRTRRIPDQRLGPPMEGLSTVHDGSASRYGRPETGPGYLGLIMEASTPSGLQIPLLHLLYSRTVTDPLSGKHFMSEPTHLGDLLTRVTPHVGPLAWWTFDRGHDGRSYFERLDGAGIRWIVRLSSEGFAGKRKIRDAEPWREFPGDPDRGDRRPNLS